MNIVVRPLQEHELPLADQIFRQAFGTFLGMPDPSAFAAGVDYVRGRWHADPAAALAAEVDGELVGSNFVTNWGSVGFFGPLTVRPDFWDRGVASRLMEATMDVFARWGTRHAGLFTFPQSPKHLWLYQKFGFWPRFLTPVLGCPVTAPSAAVPWSRYSALSTDEQARTLAACTAVTNTLYEGLDVSREIRSVETLGLGDTVLLGEGNDLTGLAVCHCGEGTEAGPGTCFIKFGAARSGPEAAQEFERLLDACQAFAASRGLSQLVAGVNTARHDAYRRLLARGFRPGFLQGVTLHRPNESGYSRQDVYALDDWR